jgi:hypothetical protein
VDRVSPVLITMTTPTFRQLMRDPVYAEYMRRTPRLYPNLQWGTPWAVLGYTSTADDGIKYRRAFKATYVEAFNMAIRVLKERRVDDVSIISRRQMFLPPSRLEWRARGLNWCGRCRRPVHFMYAPTHPMLRDAPVITSEDSIRCPLCGIRKSAIPRV